MVSVSSSSSSSHESHESHESATSQPSSIPSPSKPILSVAISGGPGDAPVQGLRIHPASKAMGRGSDTFINLLEQKDVDSLVDKYEIDHFLFEVRVPCSGKRAISLREGEIAIYQDALLGSLRIPFSSFAKAILEEYRLCPSQLTPNSWRLLNGFVILFNNYGVNPTICWFRMLFSLHLESNADWYYFSARSGRKFLGNPMEDDDLDLARGILASFEGEVHPPLPRGRKKKEVTSSKSANTSKEEKKKRKRKDVTSPKERVKSDLVVGSCQENRTKKKNSEDASGPGITREQANSPQPKILPALAPIPEGPSPSRPEDILLREVEAGEAVLLDKLREVDLVLKGPAIQRKELPSEVIPVWDPVSVKNGLMAMRPEQLSTKLREAGREEATRQLFRSAMMGSGIRGKEKKQLAVIHAHEQDKAERLQQLAAMEKEKNDLATKLVNSEGSLLTAEGDIKKLQDESSSLKEELKSAQTERAEARWELKLKVAELAAFQT
ncbi:hypothetical protein J5N97_009792 [Dioscorea zingiberensis]|uniref:Transposase (putative) gypsy type domain-containing protein n=1 Tax=Dioscorea zingiberensis TaxID=325984 RepID=A0A9D5CZG1_9LILI|nr:hypothetical protein J5N97_009792 [Dioscorea zingiberensis]